ncbi:MULTISPECIES: OmpA family protein [unclassified Clostridium]|uniref:OmpA family protein n=1 Tax=unclassified Clostridium TaxID=2614128 RepID=UPI0032175CDB
MAKKEIKTDGWLATYADTVTLLLTFFVLLYSLSSIDSQKFQQIAVAMQSAFSGKADRSILEFNSSSGDVPIVGKPQLTVEDAQENENLEILEDVLTYIKENDLEKDVQIYEDEKGLNIQMKDSVLFDTGKAELRSDSKNVLDKVSDLIGKVDNKIIIEGHTDNVPINTPAMPNNWHLSSARALSVLDYFLDSKKILNPQRFSAQGCGEYRPIAKNDTDEGRAKNRRVNIIVVTNVKEQ